MTAPVGGIGALGGIGGAGAVSGLTGVTGATPAAGAARADGVGGTGASFGSALAQGLQQLQDLQANADQLAVKAATGDLTDVHSYTIAAAEASTATQLTTAVRNKAVEAFTEVMRMPL